MARLAERERHQLEHADNIQRHGSFPERWPAVPVRGFHKRFKVIDARARGAACGLPLSAVRMARGLVCGECVRLAPCGEHSRRYGCQANREVLEVRKTG